MASNSSSLVLTDHDEIRRWAEERDARPSAVRSTGGDADIGIIRLDFPGYSGEDSLEEVSWDEWFEKFDESGLALVVQEETANGQRSNFNKLVSRDSVEQESSKKKSSRRGSTGRKSASGNGRTRSASDSSERRSTGRSSNSTARGSSGRSSKKKAASSGSRTQHASGGTKRSVRSTGSRGAQSAKQGKSSRRRAA